MCVHYNLPIKNAYDALSLNYSEGQIVAIKKMPKSDIILTNAIRKEVLQVR